MVPIASTVCTNQLQYPLFKSCMCGTAPNFDSIVTIISRATYRNHVSPVLANNRLDEHSYVNASEVFDFRGFHHLFLDFFYIGMFIKPVIGQNWTYMVSVCHPRYSCLRAVFHYRIIKILFSISRAFFNRIIQICLSHPAVNASHTVEWAMFSQLYYMYSLSSCCIHWYRSGNKQLCPLILNALSLTEAKQGMSWLIIKSWRCVKYYWMTRYYMTIWYTRIRQYITFRYYTMIT